MRMSRKSLILFAIAACAVISSNAFPFGQVTSSPVESASLSVKSRMSRSLFFGMPYHDSSEGAKGPSPAMSDGRLKFVPIKDFIDRAKGDPVLISIIGRALQRVGFDGEEVSQLLSRGKSTFKGNHVTIDDVSKFCCPLGV